MTKECPIFTNFIYLFKTVFKGNLSGGRALDVAEGGRAAAGARGAGARLARDCSVRLERLASRAARAPQPAAAADSDGEHQSYGTPEKEETCDICGESFDLKSDLIKHVAVHIHVPTSAEQGAGRPDVTGNAPALVSPAAVSSRRRSCAVRLERLLPDAARRSCRVGRRTYKLRAAEPAAAASYQCHHCGERFTNKSVLKKHVHTHSPLHHSTVGDQKLYKKGHMITQISGKLFSCSHCSYKSSWKSTLRRHLMTHTDEKPFSCSHCGYKTRTKSTLRTHLMTHTDEKPFSCSHCGYKTRTKSTLRTHLMTHTDEKPLICSHCGYKFKTKSYLRRHLMTHIDEKPFRCSHCGYKLRSKANLWSHLMTHTDEKPFRCTHCGYKCKRKADLRTHLMTHTGEKPFSCSHCDYKCIIKANLQAHVMTHTDKKPFRCTHCGYKCKRKNKFTDSPDNSHKREAFQLYPLWLQV
ncbi:gastrula zinc finger protein XlCGF57.1-like [Cydia pomonella]|uniref:gastrula zinc finger protein XlCGF57.1-like n=1 Tax=Cydia pomonella TaxID=82600 RepID=UPI002ADE064B|nr:gastrula zinc finger protein XlCGF57.1-like [Cydia pomonella]